MRFLGFEITRQKAMSAVPSSGGWFGVVRESFAGAFQSNIQVDAPRNILAFSGVFASTTLIAGDIAKLDQDLMEEVGGIYKLAPKNSPYWQVLRKPNHFQNRIQFVEQWILSKLLYGNTYALKERDARGMVNALYILDAQRVTPMVADSGDVYYKLSADHLAGLASAITVPASEIIHDRMNCLWHPLVGISPIYACGMSATMGNRIQANSTKFFDNMSRPSGVLTAPAKISDEVAGRLKRDWEENFSGSKVGRVAVLGDGLKYEGMSIAAVDAQLIEQLKWTVEDVARCFHMPLFKIGAAQPVSGLSIEAQQQLYLNDCLHILIESLEECLGLGLELKDGYEVEIDEDGLLRMDKTAQYDALNKAVSGGWMAPNEAREKVDLGPVDGGDSPMIQQQNYSLAALAKRDAKDDPFTTAKPPAPVAEPAPQPEPAKQFDVLEFVKALDRLELVDG